MGLEDDLRKALDNQHQGNQELAALQQRVAKGESLGDPLKDYLLVHYGTTDFPAVEERLRALSETVKAHNGQQVMVLYVKSELEERRGGCFGGDVYNHEFVGQQLGVLNGDLTYNLENGAVVLPTDKYVQKGEESFIFMITEESWRLKGGGIPIPGYTYYQPGTFMENSAFSKREMLFDDEVELYFSTGKTYFESYLEARSQSWKEELLEESKMVNGEYIAASTLLGVKVPARFKEKYDTKLRQRKEDILEKIKNPNQVKQYLAKALELNLHQEEREIELQPGVKMNVPEYIRAQCEKYKIKIPE